MSFFQALSPNTPPPYAEGKGDLQLLREKILQTLLLGLAVVGGIVTLLGGINSIQEGNSILALLYVGLFSALLITAISRRWSFSTRGHIVTTLVYILAVSELIESGSLGEVRMFLLTYVTLIAILFDYKNLIFAVFLSLFIIIASGVYVDAVETPIFPAMANIGSGTDWLVSSASFFMLSVALGGSVITLISGLEANLLKEAELTKNLAEERDSLEDRIQERTRSMSRRLVQLRTAADVSRSISALTEPSSLLPQVVELIRERFNLYYVGVFLLDADRNNAVLQAGSGDAGRRMMTEHHRLVVGGSSMIGWCISNRKARITLDVGSEAVRFNNPNLPLTRSEIALPVIAADSVLGAMTIQSSRPNAFDENDITVLQGIADSLGTAIDNDRLYKETRQRLDEIRALNREYLQRAWSEAIDQHGVLAYTFDNTAAPVIADSETRTIEVPLLLRDEVIGTLLLDTDANGLNEEDRAFIDNITNQTAIALENARLLEQTERRSIQEKQIHELANRFSRALSIDEILKTAVQTLGQLPSIAEVSVHLSPAGTMSPHAPEPHLGSNGNGNGKEHAA